MGFTVPQAVLCVLSVCLPWARSLGQGLGTCDIPKATPLCHPNEQGLRKLNTPRANEWIVTVQILCSWRPRGINLLETCKAEKRDGGRRLLSTEERQLEINDCGEQDWVEKTGTEAPSLPIPFHLDMDVSTLWSVLCIPSLPSCRAHIPQQTGISCSSPRAGDIKPQPTTAKPPQAWEKGVLSSRAVR